MPPLPAPVVRFLAAAADGVAFLCLTVPPLAALGATALVGDLLPAPTDVELGAAGILRLFASPYTTGTSTS